MRRFTPSVAWGNTAHAVPYISVISFYVARETALAVAVAAGRGPHAGTRGTRFPCAATDGPPEA